MTTYLVINCYPSNGVYVVSSLDKEDMAFTDKVKVINLSVEEATRQIEDLEKDLTKELDPNDTKDWSWDATNKRRETVYNSFEGEEIHNAEELYLEEDPPEICYE